MKNAITEMNLMVKRLDVQIELINSDASKKRVRVWSGKGGVSIVGKGRGGLFIF